MKRTKVSIFLAIFICGIAAILLFLGCYTYAYSDCQLDLPLDPQDNMMIVDVHEYEPCGNLLNFSGYLDATLDVPPGYSVTDGTYNTFCADLEGHILDNPLFGDVIYEIQLLSSIDNPTFGNGHWNEINYILNHYPIPQNSWLDVQAAIWTLIYGCTPQSDPTLFDCRPPRADPYFFPYGASSPYGCNGIVDKVKVQQIFDDAYTNGSGFTPGNGNLFAIIIDPQSCTGNDSYCNPPFQILFITATCYTGSIVDVVRIWREPPPGDPFPKYHSLIQDAYYDIDLSGGDIIQIRALDFNENVQCNHDVSVTLAGGYDSNFERNPLNTLYTTINGDIGLPTLTISNGTVTVENIIIQ